MTSVTSRDACVTIRDSLVVEDNVGPPDMIGWNVEHVDAAVLTRIPRELVVVPVLGGLNCVINMSLGNVELYERFKVFKNFLRT